MLKLPNLEKNSFLTIYISDSDIYANIAYVDYSSGRNYVLSDITQLSSLDDSFDTDSFWSEYFEQLKKKFNWEFFRGKEIMTVASEGVGVSGIKVVISNKQYKFEYLVSKIREVSFDITFESVDANYITNILNNISNRLNYKDILYVNIDLSNFYIQRYITDSAKLTLSKSHKQNFETNVFKIRWDEKSSLVNNIHNSKLKAFLSLDTEQRIISNTWANFVNKPVLKTNSIPLRDLIRSYISVQLITMINESNGKLDNIGSFGETLVLLSGNLIDLLSGKELLLTIIDGLELRGAIDLKIDTEGKILSFGTEFSKGIEATNFVFSQNDIFKDMKKIVVGELKEDKQQRKVVFSGKSEFSHKGVQDIYALAPEINVFDIDNHKGFFNGKFVQKASWGEGYVDFEVFSDPATVSYKSVVIDCRPKPVVYGPSPRSNRSKLNAWINEVS